jgi:hypothetical protein
MCPELQVVPVAVRPASETSGASRLWSASRLRWNRVALPSPVGRRGPSLLDESQRGTPGNGLLLFFRVDDFALALQRARALVTRLEEEPHVNPNTQTRDFSLRDPEGYYVTISALSAPRRRAPTRRRPKKRLQPTKARGRLRKSREGRPRLRG